MSLIRMAAVGRIYAGPPPVTALHDADLRIGAGEYVAITGPSGSGKSTLLNLLGLLDRPSSGEYHIDGQETAALSTRDVDQIRSQVFGFVFQSAHMINRWSVAANVALGLRAQGSPRSGRATAVRDALDLVGLSHRAQARAMDLSGGERQRAAIARAVCTRPEVLLADEPTGNLDSQNAVGVLDLFDRIHCAGVTVVVITHDETVATRARRRITVRDGRVNGGVISRASR